jgi:hypothetical protein
LREARALVAENHHPRLKSTIASQSAKALILIPSAHHIEKHRIYKSSRFSLMFGTPLASITAVIRDRILNLGKGPKCDI